jgi:two-component system sensor histidine kinase KdpD
LLPSRESAIESSLVTIMSERAASISLRESIAWFGVMAVLTAMLVALRDTLDPAHFALAYLIVVQLASARGGRGLGIALAVLAFLSFNWFLVPPFYTFRVAHSADWLVLLALLATSLVSAQLLHRAQREAGIARRRAAEVDRLAALGAETLNAARAEDALMSIVQVIRSVLAVDDCVVYTAGPDGGARTATASTDRPSRPVSSLAHRVLEHGEAAAERRDGTYSLGVHLPLAPALLAVDPPITTLLLPLRVRNRVVAVLGVRRESGLMLSADQIRVLEALSYYAALGVERVRLASEADRAAALQEAHRAKDEVLAAVSHDLRTPLTTIKGLAHQLRETGDERARIVEEEADRLNHLVTDVLEVSRINSGAVSVDLQPNEAEDLVGAAARQAIGFLDGRELRIRVEPPGALLLGLFDFSHTLRALVNLLENAAAYSPAGSPLDLSVRRDGPSLVIDVADRGPGITRAERERVFEPFYRVRSDVRGTGLGLFIARRLVEAQGGAVTYRDRDGGGSVFSLRVPALDVAGGAPQTGRVETAAV